METVILILGKVVLVVLGLLIFVGTLRFASIKLNIFNYTEDDSNEEDN